MEPPTTSRLPLTEHGPNSNPPGSAFNYVGLPPVLNSAAKFAFDVFDVVEELSNGNLKLASGIRPNFHPGCHVLMTPDTRLLFREQWEVAQLLNVELLTLTIGSFMVMLREVHGHVEDVLPERRVRSAVIRRVRILVSLHDAGSATEGREFEISSYCPGLVNLHYQARIGRRRVQRMQCMAEKVNPRRD